MPFVAVKRSRVNGDPGLIFLPKYMKLYNSGAVCVVNDYKVGFDAPVFTHKVLQLE